MNTSSTTATAKQVEAPSGAWWRYPHMWLVVGGPLVVVVAGISTYFIATSSPDPVLNTREATSAAASVGRQGDDANTLQPAQQARNHVATGGVVGIKKP